MKDILKSTKSYYFIDGLRFQNFGAGIKNSYNDYSIGYLLTIPIVDTNIDFNIFDDNDAKMLYDYLIKNNYLEFIKKDLLRRALKDQLKFNKMMRTQQGVI